MTVTQIFEFKGVIGKIFQLKGLRISVFKELTDIWKHYLIESGTVNQLITPSVQSEIHLNIDQHGDGPAVHRARHEAPLADGFQGFFV